MSRKIAALKIAIDLAEDYDGKSLEVKLLLLLRSLVWRGTARV
jgi:hypothetical protein